MLTWLRSLMGTTLRKSPGVERTFEVVVSEEGVVCHRLDGLVESVLWPDLRAVFVATTDRGPYVPDSFWILVGNQGAV